MGKGARLRRERQQNAPHIPAEVRREIERSVKKETRKQAWAAYSDLIMDECAIFFWVLHEKYGFGKKRLRDLYDAYDPLWEELREHYELTTDDTPFVCRAKLKEIGVDLDAWAEEPEVNHDSE